MMKIYKFLLAIAIIANTFNAAMAVINQNYNLAIWVVICTILLVVLYKSHRIMENKDMIIVTLMEYIKKSKTNESKN